MRLQCAVSESPLICVLGTPCCDLALTVIVDKRKEPSLPHPMGLLKASEFQCGILVSLLSVHRQEAGLHRGLMSLNPEGVFASS